MANTKEYINNMKRETDLSFIFEINEKDLKTLIKYIDKYFISKYELKKTFNLIIDDFSCNCGLSLCAECAFKEIWNSDINGCK